MYQNCVVRIDAFDNNMQKAAYYGQIEEIWELSYLGFKVPVFGVDGIREDRVS